MTGVEEWMTYEKLEGLLRESGRSYDMGLIGRAYEVASKAHHGVKRRSGEPISPTR